MPGYQEISPNQLMRLIGTPDAPLVIDVRLPEDVSADPFMIPTSRPSPHKDVVAAAGAANRKIVVTCMRGLKLSQGAAALLRSHGIDAETLAGGTEAWAAAGLPRVPISALEGTNLWVTRHRPKIDRIACPWLIRRFIDPEARFLFVAPAEVAAVADRFGAIPFDIDGVPHSHRGDRCSFDTMLDLFGLHTQPLDLMALVIRAADTNRHDLHPAAAGLLALSVGLSRQYKDDNAQLGAGLALYDALYRWARDGADEGHDWQPEASK